MRLLQISHQYPPHHIGGVELITHNLAHDLAQQGHQVTVLTRAPSAPSTAQDDASAAVQVVRWPERSPTRRFLDAFGDPAALRDFDALLNNQPFDVVHLQHLIGFPARLADTLARRRIPYAVTLHDYWYACANAQLVTNTDGTLCAGPQPTSCGRCAGARAGLGGSSGAVLAPLFAHRTNLLRDVLRRAALVSAPSHYVVHWFADHGYDTRAWRVIPYGIDVTQRPAPCSRTQTHFAYLGGIARQKGVHTLVDAFNHMPADATLTIAGPLDAHPDYVAQLRAAAAHPGIRFTGALDRTGVWQLLHASHALVAPSIWPETFMLVLHEALAAGCHIIASDLGAQGEAARAAGAFTFPPGDAVALAAQMRAALAAPPRTTSAALRTHREYAAEFERLYAAIHSASAKSRVRL